MVCLIAIGVGCDRKAVVVPPADQGGAGPAFFGYSAVACGHDDPLDDSTRSDYTDEVADFTNANQVCVTEDVRELAERLRRVRPTSSALLYVEPVFFQFDGGRGVRNPAADALWTLVRQAISESGLPADRVVFYVADEPNLRGLPLEVVRSAVDQIDRTYPDAATLVVEGDSGPGRSPVVPPWVDYWGFVRYGVRNPATDPGYRSYLDDAIAQLGDGQQIALIMDASYTPTHSALGFVESDMAIVADNYFTLARQERRVGMLLAYTWAGGIDSLDEKGVRDMDPVVANAHRRIGTAIVTSPRRP